MDKLLVALIEALPNNNLVAVSVLLVTIVTLGMWVYSCQQQKKVVWPRSSIQLYISKLAQFCQDGTGALSATRLVFIVAAFMILGTWAWNCYTTKKFLPFDSSQIYLIGALMAGKVAQSFTENQTADSIDTTIGKQPTPITVNPVTVVQAPPQQF